MVLGCGSGMPSWGSTGEGQREAAWVVGLGAGKPTLPGWSHRLGGGLLCPSAPQLASDPALHRKLARLSAGSFARLVELFSTREGSASPNCSSPSVPCPGPPPPSPDPLARLALAMELSRRVAGLGGTLANLSVEHVHSFVPWIQAHGGWVSQCSPCQVSV